MKIDFFLQNNEITTFKRGTFHSQANPDLCILDLSFNSITSIPYDTFRFPRLERLLLDDNQIWDIDSKVKSIQNSVLNCFDCDSRILPTYHQGGFYSESAIRFLDLQISKKNIPKNYPKLEIWICCLLFLAGNLNFKPRIAFRNIFFGDLEI